MGVIWRAERLKALCRVGGGHREVNGPPRFEGGGGDDVEKI